MTGRRRGTWLVGAIALVAGISMGVTLYGAFFIVLFSAIVDFIYAYLDPRVRPT